MQYITRKLFRIQKGEGRKAGLLFTYIFLLISSLLIIKPVSNALFIRNIGIEMLPLGFILVALFSGLLMSLYIPLTGRLPLISLISVTSMISLGFLGLFWILFSEGQSSSITFYAFYIWVSIYGVITASQFWLFSGRVLNPRQGKRLFGFIGSGGIAGGIFGGCLTTALVESVGTRNLIFISMTFLTACLFISRKIWNIHTDENTKEAGGARNTGTLPVASKNPFKTITGSRHIFYIACIVSLSVAAATLGDYVFRHIAAVNFTNEDDLTRFFGFWQSILSILALLIQLFVTSKIISKLGVTWTLAVLPGGVALGALFVIFNPAVLSAVILKMSDGAFKQSIYKSGMEMLYFPISSRAKKQIKGFIDVFLDNFSTGLAGLLLFCLINFLSWSVVHISYIILGLTAAWLFGVLLIKKTYLQSFRAAIEQKTIDFDDPGAPLDNLDFLKYLEAAIESKSTKRILYMLNLMSDLQHPGFVSLLARLLKMPSREVKKQALLVCRNFPGQFNAELDEIVIKGPQDLRIEAMYNLFLASENKIKYIKDTLRISSKDLQWAVLICAARECHENEELRDLLTLDSDVRNFMNPGMFDYQSGEEVITHKTFLARTIGTAGLTALYPQLEQLLHDNDHSVVMVAISYAGRSKSDYFCRPLINMLGHHRYTEPARKALVSIGNESINIINEFLSMDGSPDTVLHQLPRVLSYLPRQESVDVLERYLPDSSADFYDSSLRALAKLKALDTDLMINKKLALAEAVKSLKKWFMINGLISLADQQRHKKGSYPAGVDSAFSLLERALLEKGEILKELVFILLGLRHNQVDLRNAYLGISSSSTRLNANALEYLDNLLDARLKSLLFPIIENHSPDKLVKKNKEVNDHSFSSFEDILLYLARENDPWIATCSLHLMVELKMELNAEQINYFKNNKFSLVAETAEHLQKAV